MTVLEFEKAVFEREEVRIVIRAPTSQQVGNYAYVRCSPGTSSITEWLEQRIYPATGNLEVTVIDGNLLVPHGRTRMVTLRETYVR